MKKLLVLSSLLLIIGMVLGCVGCGTKKALNTNPSFLKYGVLQGKIMDALTGAAIGGKDLKVYLIEGKTNRKPDKLITDTKNPLVGEYAFDSVPVNIIANEITFKVVIIKDGYQRFEANVSIEANFAEANTTDEVFNKIGNIYLYPLGTSASDVTVYVYSPQYKPILNATVLLQQDVTNNNTISYIGDRLAATAGLYPSLTNTTDSTGKATFSGADLTLGGSYRVVVEALTFEGQELETATSAAFITGVDPTTQPVNMAAIGNWLFATSASNSVQGTITADGSLTITFNQPIILSTMSFTANMTGGGIPSPQTVTGVLSNSNTTLTLRPNITTAPSGKGATISYEFLGTIFLQNSQLATNTLFTGYGSDVKNITTGKAVSGEVQMTSN